jgi:hypothetical protein
MAVVCALALFAGPTAAGASLGSPGPRDAFTDPGVPLVPVPDGPEQPSVVGKLVQGKTVTASPGSWSNAPTAYAYQWERCTAKGGRCVAIDGQTGAAHTLSTADVGHRLRVAVSAYNSAGAGPVEVSALTAIVKPRVFLALKEGSLTRAAANTARLVLKLAIATGQQPLKTVTISLPAGLTLAGHAADGISVVGTEGRFRFRLATSTDELKVICRSRTFGLLITVSPAVLRADQALVNQPRSRRLGIGLNLLVTEAYGGRARTRMKVQSA